MEGYVIIDNTLREDYIHIRKGDDFNERRLCIAKYKGRLLHNVVYVTTDISKHSRAANAAVNIMLTLQLHSIKQKCQAGLENSAYKYKKFVSLLSR